MKAFNKDFRELDPQELLGFWPYFFNEFWAYYTFTPQKDFYIEIIIIFFLWKDILTTVLVEWSH